LRHLSVTIFEINLFHVNQPREDPKFMPGTKPGS